MDYGERFGAWWADDAEPKTIRYYKDGFVFEGRNVAVPNIRPASKNVALEETIIKLMLERSPGKDHPRWPFGNGYGCPGLLISDRCVNLADEFEEYTRVPDAVLKTNKKSMVDRKGPNHALKALGYCLMNSAREYGLFPQTIAGV
jgi:hypothetical protein